MNSPDFKFTNVVDSAVGYFGPDSWNDHGRLHETMRWCHHHCKDKWRRSIYVADGKIVFEFADRSDADALRRVSNRAPSMIPCR